MSSDKLFPLSDVIHRDEDLTLDDGIKLKSRIWFPKKKKKWPALLMRQPYGKEIASTVTYPHPSWLAQNGFLVIIQDVRGQGESTGHFSGFGQEAEDTSQSHQWARNLPECNGLLGTYGFSYQGLTQLIAIPGTHPPECMAPAMTGLHEGTHWSCQGGAFWWHIGISWGLQLAALKARREGNSDEWNEIRRSLENGDYLRYGTDLLQKYDPEGMAQKWLDNSKNSCNSWTIHKPLKTWLKKPMLLIGGWWDPHLVGVLDIYQQSLEAGGNPSLHIGPASHLEWWEGSQKILLNFFKQNLQKYQNIVPLKSEKQLWNITTKRWAQLKKFQPSPPTWGLINYGLANISFEEGLLEPHSKGAGSIILVHDPWRPIPAIGGHLSPTPGEVDRSDIDKRFDIAKFTSCPLKETLSIEGIPILKIQAFADQKGFDLCVALSLVDPVTTKATQLSTGFIRIIGEEALKTSCRTINLQPILADFPKNMCLRISIGGSAWPAIGINPGDPKKTCGAPSPDCLVTNISLDFSDSKLSFSPLITHEGFQD